MKRIKWNNVIKALVFVIALYVIIHDVYVMFISPIFTTKLMSWTYFGLITFGLSLYYVIAISEEIKKGDK